MLDFKNFKFLTVKEVEKVEMHQCAKFRRNRLNCGPHRIYAAIFYEDNAV